MHGNHAAPQRRRADGGGYARRAGDGKLYAATVLRHFNHGGRVRPAWRETRRSRFLDDTAASAAARGGYTDWQNSFPSPVARLGTSLLPQKVAMPAVAHNGSQPARAATASEDSHTTGVTPLHAVTNPDESVGPARVAFDAEVAMPEAPHTIPDSNDRLVRHLFDIGLQLHTVRAVFEQECSTPEELRTARAAVISVLDDLDSLIRDAGTAMLDLALQQEPPAPTSRARRRRRR
ncbi:hypothetical protein [Nocardia blacklockiae]|uniref:hypothetical protein n=1 Tax=Nocardia blacklockiae TaxID=480036 RepID=UPI001894DD25|nr:hypothetical protein [Nocardia blacklockiae]MBF6172173.1 hypothetical protein [Nocardia blacklockiae]